MNEILFSVSLGQAIRDYIAKQIGSSQQPDGKALMLKTIPIQLIEHGSIKPGPMQNLQPTDQCSLYWKVLCRLQEEKGKCQASCIPEIYNGNLPAEYTGVIATQTFCE